MHGFVQRPGGRVLRNFHRVPRVPVDAVVEEQAICGDVVEPPAAAPPAAAPPPPAAAAAPAPAPASLPPALAWTTAVGVTVTSGVRREAD
eukprot:6767365-Prymnesium_polylepis.1